MTTTLRGQTEQAPDDGPGRVAPPRTTVFVSGRCLFRYAAMFDLMSWWARGRSNEEYVLARIGDARSDLARGADRAAAVRSVMHLFRGVDEGDVVAATRSFLRSAEPWSHRPGAPPTVAASTGAGTEVVLVSDLALFSLVDEVEGVDAVLSSSPVCADGRLTGEVELVLQGARRRRAITEFAASRGVPLSDCAFLHRGDAEDADASEAVGTVVDLRVRDSSGGPGEG
jgi:phosphoserine phosphatase